MLYIHVIRYFKQISFIKFFFFFSRIRCALKLSALKIKLVTRCTLNNYSQKLFETGCALNWDNYGKQQGFDSIKKLNWLSQSWVSYGLIGFFIFLEQLFCSALSRNCFWSLIFQLNYLQIIFLVYWIIKTLVFIPNPFRKPVPRYVFLRNSLLTDPILVQHFHEIWWLFLKFICD